MQETWDSLWSKREVFDIKEVISYDSCYHLLKRLIEPPPGNGSNILEVGCGSGIYTLSLLREFPNFSPNAATLVDFSPVALAFAGKNAEQNGVQANLVLADALKLPFHDSSFDIVWNGGVNEHFSGEARQLIFDEMARVCKPGGQVIIVVPNSLNLPYRLWKGVLEMQGGWEYGLEIPYSIFELKNKLRNARMTPTKVRGRGTLGSLFFLGRIITREKESDDKIKTTTNRVLRMLRKIVVITDSMLGFIGGFTGAEIGIKGIKHD